MIRLDFRNIQLFSIAFSFGFKTDGNAGQMNKVLTAVQGKMLFADIFLVPAQSKSSSPTIVQMFKSFRIFITFHLRVMQYNFIATFEPHY